MLPLPPTSTLFPYTTLFRSPLGNWTSFTYDALNRLIQTRDALNGLSTLVYDAASNVIATVDERGDRTTLDRKSTRLNSSHRCISYAVFCLKKKNNTQLNSNI